MLLISLNNGYFEKCESTKYFLSIFLSIMKSQYKRSYLEDRASEASQVIFIRPDLIRNARTTTRTASWTNYFEVSADHFFFS